MDMSVFERRLTGFVIHGFDVGHTIWTATSAQTIFSNAVTLSPLTAAMIITISRINNTEWNVGNALSVTGDLNEWYFGTRGTKPLIKWEPETRDVANFNNVPGIAEMIGWTTYLLIKEGRTPHNLSSEHKERLKEQARQLRDEEHEISERMHAGMSAQDKNEYNIIMKQLRYKDLPELTIMYLSRRFEEISKKYVLPS